MTSLVRITPRTLRDKLRYTDNIEGVRDKCQVMEILLKEKALPLVREAYLDLLIYGNAWLPVPWKD